MHQTGIVQPLQRILVFSGPGALFHHLVYKFLIFPGQLGGNGFPDHRYFGELAYIRMLCKVPFICIKNARQRFLHSAHVPRLRPHQHRFRHASGHIIHFQFFLQWIKKSVRKRFYGINAVQIYRQVFVSIGNQKLREGHGIDLHEIHFAHRKRGRLCQCNSQQRPCAGNMKFRRILTKIFHGIDDPGTILHLVKNDQRPFRHHLLSARHHEVLQNAFYIHCRFKKLPIFLIFIKVEISRIFIILPAKFLQKPGLAHLPDPFHDQGLAIWRFFPFQQLFHSQTFHAVPSHYN